MRHRSGGGIPSSIDGCLFPAHYQSLASVSVLQRNTSLHFVLLRMHWFVPLHYEENAMCLKLLT